MTAFEAPSIRVSALQHDVADALRELQLSPAEEVKTELGYTIDLVVEWQGQRVGVEVDGPWHFIGPTGNEPEPSPGTHQPCAERAQITSAHDAHARPS